MMDKENYKSKSESSLVNALVIGLINELKSEAEKLEKGDWYSDERLTGYNDAISDLGVAVRELGYTKIQMNNQNKETESGYQSAVNAVVR